MPVLEKIADRLTAKSGEQIGVHAVNLFWCKAKGVVAVTASGNEKRIQALSRLARAKVSLTAAEVSEIDKIGRRYHYRYYVGAFTTR